MSKVGWLFTSFGFILIGQLILMSLLHVPWTEASLGFTGIYGYFALMGFMLTSWLWEPRLMNWVVELGRSRAEVLKEQSK